MQAWVAEKAAKAYATDGQDTACMVECEEAQAGLTSAGQLLAESLTYWYHTEFLTYEMEVGRSWRLLQLGKPQGGGRQRQYRTDAL
jgi:hypothetical protein